jgi:hypothetical protein
LPGSHAAPIGSTLPVDVLVTSLSAKFDDVLICDVCAIYDDGPRTNVPVVVAPPLRFADRHVALIGNEKLFDDDAVACAPSRYFVTKTAEDVAVGGVVVPAHVSFHTTINVFAVMLVSVGELVATVLEAAAERLFPTEYPTNLNGWPFAQLKPVGDEVLVFSLRL